MATMADVARLAGVSVATVSHVLNGTRPVLPHTRQAVLDAIDELGYTPNTLARSLVTSRTRSIGLAVSAISNPYFTEIVQGVEAGALEHGYSLLIADPHDDPEHERKVGRLLHERRVDGMIVAPSADPRGLLAHLARHRVPTVFLDRLVDGVPTVTAAWPATGGDASEGSGHADGSERGGHTDAAAPRGHADAAEPCGHADTAEQRAHAGTSERRTHADASEPGEHAEAAEREGHAEAAQRSPHANVPKPVRHTDAPERAGHLGTSERDRHAGTSERRTHADASEPGTHADAPFLFDQVCAENAEPMARLVTHLADLGHRRIGLIAGVPGLSTTTERISGYLHGLATAGLPYDERLVARGDSAAEGAERATAALLSLAAPPTALVTANNAMTIGALRALRDRGLSVPDDLALCCFDDFAWADLFSPRLTAISQPSREIGAQAVRLLLDRLEAPDRPSRTVRLPCAFVHRTSCGCPDSRSQKGTVS
ncbi:substrate-binding domain-containing protein [Streptomyces yaanensis]